MSGSLKTASEAAKYNFDLVAIQEVWWGNGGSELADNYTFIDGNAYRLLYTLGNH